MTRVLLIFDPQNGSDAAVNGSSPMYQGSLLAASGSVTGQVAEVIAVCERVSEQGAPGSYTSGQIKTLGKTVKGFGPGSWSATMIPGAQCHPDDESKQWNVLKVCTFFYGYPPTQASIEPATFRGVMPNNNSLHTGLLEQLQQNDGPASASNIGKKIFDLIDTWWERDVSADRHSLREPTERAGKWMLYENLPVDTALGAALGLNGKPLRASVLSIAVESIEVRRKLAPPFAHVGTPFGTGEIAFPPLPLDDNCGDEVDDENVTVWRFPRFPQFATIIHQPELGFEPASNHLLTSMSRKFPATVFVDNRRPIHIAINSPKTEDFLNEGHLNLWVRVEG